MCAPREVVLQQMWREEDDGTFIVLLHSTKHRKASMPPPSWSWWQPVRAQVGPPPVSAHILLAATPRSCNSLVLLPPVCCFRLFHVLLPPVGFLAKLENPPGRPSNQPVLCSMLLSPLHRCARLQTSLWSQCCDSRNGYPLTRFVACRWRQLASR